MTNLKKNLDEIGGGIESLFYDNYLSDFNFKAIVQGHELEFWSDIQLLHDNPIFWQDANKLSNEGEIRKNELIKKWS